MAAITIARDRGLTVLASTRQQAKRAALEADGADQTLVVDGDVTSAVRALLPDGLDGLCELIGPRALLEALHALRPGGRACITGYLEGDWNADGLEATAEKLQVELRRFGSGVINRDSYGQVFQEIVEAIQEGRYGLNLDRVFPMGEIADAHRYMEEDRAAGKVVVVPPED
jgi:NADPH2:quinone reductase